MKYFSCFIFSAYTIIMNSPFNIHQGVTYIPLVMDSVKMAVIKFLFTE